MGIFLAVSGYIILQVGLLGVSSTPGSGDPNLYAYAVGFLMGLFSDVLMGKLAEVARTLFGRTDPEQLKKSGQ